MTFYKALLVAYGLAWSGAVFAADYGEIAERGCNCVAEPYERIRQMLPEYHAAKQAGDDARVESLENTMMPMMKNVQTCNEEIVDLMAQDDEGREAVFQLMDQACPAPEL